MQTECTEYGVQILGLSYRSCSTRPMNGGYCDNETSSNLFPVLPRATRAYLTAKLPELSVTRVSIECPEPTTTCVMRHTKLTSVIWRQRLLRLE